MHPAERDGYAVGRATAIEDRYGDLGRAVGAELLIAAKESAADWADGGHPFIDPAGRSVAAYVEAFTASYDVWMDEHQSVPRPERRTRRADG